MSLRREAHRGLLVALLLGGMSGAVLADYSFKAALPQTQPAAMQLMDIERCGDKLLVAGERGLLAWSDDDGDSWNQANVPVSQALTAVYCLDDQQAWAVGHGGVILGSQQGLQEWNLLFDGNKANQHWLEHIEALQATLETELDAASPEEAEDIEYALEDAIFALEDAQAAMETGPADPFLDVWFRDSNYGMAAGAYGMLYRTQDGGENWELMAGSIANAERYHYYALSEASEGVLYLSGEAGLLYRSPDEGENWERLDARYDGSLFGVLARDNGSALAFGLRGNIFQTDDEGESWQAVENPDPASRSLYGGSVKAGAGMILVGTSGAVLYMPANASEFDYKQLADRATLSAVTISVSGRVVAVGMDGVRFPMEND